jgi:hypothetical protein
MGKTIIPTDAEIDAIRTASEAINSQEIRAERVAVDPVSRMITLWLVGRASPRATVVSFSADVTPSLAAATDDQLAELEVYPFGTTLAIASLDLHLSVEAVVLRALMGEQYHKRLRQRAAAAMGQAKSPAKAAAVRENGKKGGRPRKRALGAS